VIGSVNRVPPSELEGEDISEGWYRDADPPEVYGVEALHLASTDRPLWQVVVAAMEFVREAPLESELRAAMAARLAAVPGVVSVEEEDREVWVVFGDPSGEALTRAAAEVIDGFASRIEQTLE